MGCVEAFVKDLDGHVAIQSQARGNLCQDLRPGDIQALGEIGVTQDPREGLADADAVYTDVWASMGQEHEADERQRTFAPYQVNAELMALAKSDAVFMHCLPAHRGSEVTDEVIDGPASVVFDQAENRLHAQKAIMATLMK